MDLFRFAPQAVPEWSGDSCRKLWKEIDPQRHLVPLVDVEYWNEDGSTSRLPSSSETSLIMLPFIKFGENLQAGESKSSPLSYIL
jgi:hypothetical protein